MRVSYCARAHCDGEIALVCTTQAQARAHNILQKTALTLLQINIDVQKKNWNQYDVPLQNITVKAYNCTLHMSADSPLLSILDDPTEM